MLCLLAGRGPLGRSAGTVSISVAVSVPVPGSRSLRSAGYVVGAVIIVRVIGAIEGWADQFAIRKTFLIRGLFGWYGVECIFQLAPPARRAGRICHNTQACD